MLEPLRNLRFYRIAGAELIATVGVVTFSFFPSEYPEAKGTAYDNSRTEPNVVCHENQHERISNNDLDEM